MDIERHNDRPHIRSGARFAAESSTEVLADQTYRLEIVGSLSTPFTYRTGLTERTVQPDTFDLYITDPEGNLIASDYGLLFRDEGTDVVQSLGALRVIGTANANNTLVTDVFFDDWHFTGGSIDGEGYLDTNLAAPIDLGAQAFFQLQISDNDQDQDGLLDSEELLLARHGDFLFFDAQTSDGTDDLTTATDLITQATGAITLSLQASDTAAFEDNSPNTQPDNGAIIISRTGPLTAVEGKLCLTPLANTGNTSTVCDGLCCTLVGSAGDEAAEPEDYTLVDEDGTVVTDTVSFDFGEMSKTLTVIATKDSLNEYPETLNLALAPDATYQISSNLNGASIQLFDLPDSPSNNAIFTGSFSLDGNAVTPSSGTGSTDAIINGPRTRLYLSSQFDGMDSNQQDAHIHKSNPGNTPADRVGPIIYAITEIPGDETSPPLLGDLDRYEWDLTSSSGAVPTAGGEASKQTLIDSLFGQNNESPLYFNVHTVDNPAGEIWSFLALTGGSITSPGEPTPPAEPGSPEFPLLTGDALDTDIRRFLNQATFGATEEDVANLTNLIATERLNQPSYHRKEAFEAWIDSQMNLSQSYILDYHLACDFQQLKLRGWFDPLLNPSNAETETPPLPAVWPTVNRTTHPDPAKWHLEGPYPVTHRHQELASDNNLGGAPNDNTRRQAFWQMMLNAPDQLRQKMGFSLQQILVISVADSTIAGSHYSSSNYQDLLNTYAFAHYRDVFGCANWSPIMGKWLSSLQNQKGIDLDGDGLDDTAPDENLARENMQLFSIGLFELWPDGTLKLGSDGAPNNTYTNDDIREFAKVLTGQSFSVQDDRDLGWGGVPFDQIPANDEFSFNTILSDLYGLKYIYPMQMFGEFHDRSIKTFAGTVIDNTHLIDPTEQGIADVEQALDWLAGKPGDGVPDFDDVNSHGTTPAFICRRLIQRFTTSNPSREYLHRVATTFQVSEGHLGATIKAILLDPEARILDLSDSHVGVKKSPLENFIQVARNLDSHSFIPLGPEVSGYPFDGAPGDFSNPDLLLTNFGYPAAAAQSMRNPSRAMFKSTVDSGTTSIVMEPFHQSTVFNWYLPDFTPTGPVSSAGLVAPEMQLANEQDVISNINYIRSLTQNLSGVFGVDLGADEDIQIALLGGDPTATLNNNYRVDLALLTSELYPDAPPPPTASESSEYLANLEVLDALDRRLTNGLLKLRYPIDPSDDGPENGSGGGGLNPRELILQAVTFGGQDPWDGNSDEFHRLNRVRDILYLITVSPDFQVKK